MAERKQTVELRPFDPWRDAESCNGCSTGRKTVVVLEVGNGASGFEWRMCDVCEAEFRGVVSR